MNPKTVSAQTVLTDRYCMSSHSTVQYSVSGPLRREVSVGSHLRSALRLCDFLANAAKVEERSFRQRSTWWRFQVCSIELYTDCNVVHTDNSYSTGSWKYCSVLNSTRYCAVCTVSFSYLHLLKRRTATSGYWKALHEVGVLVVWPAGSCGRDQVANIQFNREDTMT